LQALDLGAYRGLGDPQCFGSFGEAAQVHNSGQSSQEISRNIQHCAHAVPIVDLVEIPRFEPDSKIPTCRIASCLASATDHLRRPGAIQAGLTRLHHNVAHFASNSSTPCIVKY
jgi:hypothetical protein